MVDAETKGTAWRDVLILTLAFGALFFFMLGRAPLANPDEGRYAEIPREMVTTGDFFTIYDFGVFVPRSNTQPAGWTFSSLLIGVTPGQVSPTDNPTIPNLTWTYAGTPISGSAALGTFSLLSDTNQLRTADFAAQGTRSDGSGTKINNVGTVSVPVPEVSALAPIIGICGLGMIGFATSILRRRQIA
jgi:hypothetical protein